MRILFVTPCLPYPHGVGWQQRSFRHLTALSQIGTVDIILTSPKWLSNPEHFESAASLSNSIEVGPPSTEFEEQKQRYLSEPSPLRRLALMFTTMVPNSARPLDTANVREAARIVPDREYDIVFCFRISSARWLDMVRPLVSLRYSSMVIDFDDIESYWYERAFELERAGLSAAWRLHKRRDIWLLRRTENRLLRLGHPVLCCSQVDAAILRRRARGASVHVIPNSVPVAAHPPAPEPHEGFVVLFVGALDNDPNLDGLGFFMRDIWPLVRRELGPAARLHVVGRNPPPKLLAFDGQDGIQVVGPVPTIAPEYARADVCIAPIRFGSGTRTKILEAFAHGRPVVSTTLGAEGIDAPDGQAILLADQAEHFARAIVSLQRDDALRQRVAQAAHRFVREHYAEEVIAPRLQQVVLGAAGQAASRAA